MRAWRRIRWGGALAAGAGLALSAPPASAVTAGRVTVAVTHGQPVNHSNVGQPHSPELPRRLAGPDRPFAARQAAPALRREVIAGPVQGVDVASYQHPNGKAIELDIEYNPYGAESGLCLADPGGPAVNGTAIQVATCTQIPGEQWRIQ